MPFKCIPDCSDCCTVFPLPKNLYTIYKDQAERVVKELELDLFDGLPNNEIFLPGIYILPETSDLKCCFIGKDHRCKIYKNRPKVCRKFGQHHEMPCVHVMPNGWLRTPEEKKIMQTVVLNINEKKHHEMTEWVKREIAKEESKV